VTHELETLCRSCGLCCDGSLFGRVTLQADEVHLPVLEQPCAAHSSSACSIYAERPRACRAFTCRLYERHRREGGPLETRLEAVRRVRALLRIVETTADEAAIADLTRRMETDFARNGATCCTPTGDDRNAAKTHDRDAARILEKRPAP
jgi:hypothetical protein